MNIFITIILIILIILVLFGLVVSGIFMKVTFRSCTMDMDTTIAHYDDYSFEKPRRTVCFMSGENKLQGYIYEVNDPKGFIVFSHGIWSAPEEYLACIHFFLDHGYTVFAYDYTSYNGSEGKWAKGLSQSRKDLDAALTYIEAEHVAGDLPVYLMGHSWGAYATTSVLNYPHDVKKAVSLSGFNTPLGISLDVAKKSVTTIGTYICTPVLYLMNVIISGKDWNMSAVDGINRADIPVLLLHGVEDDFIRYDVTSIPAHRSEITSEKVEYIKLTKKGYSAHNNYFCTEDATDYTNALNDEWARIEKEIKADWKKNKSARVAEENGKNVGKKSDKAALQDKLRSEKHLFFSKMDKKRANAVNVELFDQVLAFIEK